MNSEFYPEDLQTMLDVMDRIVGLASIDGVHEIEVRFRINDMDSWVVVGYGEAGDPCVLRIEEPIKPVTPINPNKLTNPTFTTNPISPWAPTYGNTWGHEH
jgi:hypothetical protein